MRWSLRQLLLLVMAIALGLGTCRLFWGESAYFDSRILFSIYLVLLSCATMAALLSAPSARRFWQGYALFGWFYFLFVLRAGFGFTPDVYAKSLSRFSTMGVALACVCAIATQALLPRKGPVAEKRSNDA